ncbi:hypothetical protein [Streptomyces sp. ST2-7A]|uniref:hypothetical protein n=1 Tax=Streptomyces sp. ST2-7A TaxID=2907214 RepID=UPI001F1BFB04|nr:hypothetical protein [Streptomyces sp. ST2-7A]MCE7081585.1 hypothetical protein [Streptomyces sp. ST2-7A]
MNQPTTTAAGTARAAAEAIRTLNHLTFRPDERAQWEMPGDVYDVIGALAYLVGRLPQTLGQASELLESLHGTGRLRHDSGDGEQPAADVAAFGVETREAAGTAGRLADGLRHAHAALARIGYREER